MPLGGIALDSQILPFDVTEPAQLAEKRAPCGAAASLGEKTYGNGRME
jgi:hypothetical protein